MSLQLWADDPTPPQARITPARLWSEPMTLPTSLPADALTFGTMAAPRWPSDGLGPLYRLERVRLEEAGSVVLRVQARPGEPASREMAAAVLEACGPRTAMMNVAFLHLAAKVGPGAWSSVPTEDLVRVLGLDRRRDLTTQEKLREVGREVGTLRHILLTVERLTIKGKRLQAERLTGNAWEIAALELEEADLPLHGCPARTRSTLSLAVRPGAWAAAGWREHPLALRLFQSLTRRRTGALQATFALALAAHPAAGSGKPFEAPRVAEVLRLACVADPGDRTARHGIANQIRTAWLSAREWGARLDFSHMPAWMHPDALCDRADRMAKGDPLGHSTRRPRGYWDELLSAAPLVTMEAPRPPGAYVCGETLRELRERLGMSQAGLDAALGYRRGMVGQVEAGKRRIGPDRLPVLEQIARDQGVTLSA